VLALMLTGVAKETCCQPEAASALKVAVARSVPKPVQSLPTYVPGIWDPL
jgi:hypothetical protein